jgi:hypothetical protein
MALEARRDDYLSDPAFVWPDTPRPPEGESGDLSRLRRWEDSGATWRVLSRTPGDVDLALLTCDAGEQVDRLRSADPALLAYLGDRTESSDATK